MRLLTIPSLFPLPFNDLVEKMEVFYGTEQVINEELLFFSKARQQIDTCMVSTRPHMSNATALRYIAR